MQKESASSTIIRFSTFELDVRAGELRKQGARIKVQEQPLRILEMLLAHPGQLVTREELRARLWPSDTFVDFDHGLNKAINKLREALGDSAENPRFIETLAKRGYRFLGDPSADRQGIRSLLVLPLENLSGDPEQEYFADGLTEALITLLAKISALRVISRTTAMFYKRAHKPLPEIARELGVDGIIEGTVWRSEGRVRISAQLLHAPTDTLLWAESYERDVRNVFALQAEVAKDIAREIQVKLTPHEQAHFVEARRVEPEAYEMYLKGRYYLNARIRDRFGKATQCFQRAIDKDPTYAAAYSGLADCLSIRELWGLLPPQEGCGRARDIARQALTLDAELAEAHTSLAWATVNYDYDFSAAEAGFRLSIELNPNYDMVRRWFGMSLAMMGRFEEGRIELERSVRLDPCSSGNQWALGFVHWCAHQYDKAIAECEKALELEPNFGQAHWQLGCVFLGQGRNEAAVSQFQRACEFTKSAPIVVASLAAAHAAAGFSEEARSILRRLPEISNVPHVMHYFIARVYAALGETFAALDTLETAYGERAAWLILLRTDAVFDSLRSEPRFEALMRRINYPK